MKDLYFRNPLSNRWVKAEGQIGQGLLDAYGTSLERRYKTSKLVNKDNKDNKSNIKKKKSDRW